MEDNAETCDPMWSGINNMPAPDLIDAAEVYARIDMLGDVPAKLNSASREGFTDVYTGPDLQVLFEPETSTAEISMRVNGGGENMFVQLRHGGHLWRSMPDGTPVEQYLRRCRGRTATPEEVVPRWAADAWRDRKAELLGGVT